VLLKGEPQLAAQVEELRSGVGSTAMSSVCVSCGRQGRAVFTAVRDARYSVAGQWRYVACNGCGLLWIDPMPAANAVSEFYPRAYEAERSHAGRPPRAAGLRATLVRGLTAAYGYWCGRGIRAEATKCIGMLLLHVPPLSTWFPASLMFLPGESVGKLLDVGCGSGWFLRKMRSLGWSVLGLEPDPAAARKAQTEFRVPVIVGDLSTVASELGPFDAITLHHVVEHLRCPLDDFRVIKKMLSPAGRVIVVTPNARSLGFRLFRRDCWHLEAPRHLFLYTAHGLARVASQAGLTPVRTLTITRTAAEVYVRSCQIRATGGRFPWEALPGFWARAAGQAFRLAEEACRLTLAGLGEELVMILEARDR